MGDQGRRSGREADTVDYLVVGAGTAGSVLAARLSEDPRVEVAMLEVGGSDSNPAIWAKDLRSLFSLWTPHSRENWGYGTVPQAGLGGRSIPIARGKVLGGSSAINAMIHVRGNRRDFDRWRDLGNDGWSFEDVLPYFKRSETYHGPESTCRGRKGPVSVIDCREPSPVSHAFVEAAADLSCGERNVDFNGAVQEAGGGFYQSTRTPDGLRVTAASAFIRPAAGRKNLRVRLDVRATRLVFDRGRVVGVECAGPTGVEAIRVEREVVLCCGAFETPKLLMLSGVGPADDLARQGIPLVQHLPGVGQNLQDHVMLGVVFESRATLDAPELLAEAGLFTWTPGAAPRSSPDLQYFCSPIQFTTPRYTTRGPGFTLAPVLVQPRSRGRVGLASRDPAALARVDAGYLEAREDVAALEHGIRLARALAHGRAFEGLRGRELAPGEDVAGADALRAFARETATTVWHPAGTCRMGWDVGAVVDAELRVHGLAGLRIADASVMPEIVNGNPNAAVMMIAERAADLMTKPRGQNERVAPAITLSTGPAVTLEPRLAEYRARVASVICEVLLEGNARGGLRDLVADELSRGPAGLGPALCQSTAAALGASETQTLPLAAASELFRRAWLSRDRASLGGAFGARSLLVGSALGALSLRLVRRSLPALGPGLGGRVLEEFDRAAIEATEGRALALGGARGGAPGRAKDDVPVALRSTIWQSYVFPLRLAALVAGRQGPAVGGFDRFGTLVGLARELDSAARTPRGVRALVAEALHELDVAYAGAAEGPDLDFVRAVSAESGDDAGSSGTCAH